MFLFCYSILRICKLHFFLKFHISSDSVNPWNHLYFSDVVAHLTRCNHKSTWGNMLFLLSIQLYSKKLCWYFYQFNQSGSSLHVGATKKVILHNYIDLCRSMMLQLLLDVLNSVTIELANILLFLMHLLTVRRYARFFSE